MYISTYYEQKFRMTIKQCSRYIKIIQRNFCHIFYHFTQLLVSVCLCEGASWYNVDWYIPGSLVGNHFSMARCLY